MPYKWSDLQKQIFWMIFTANILLCSFCECFYFRREAEVVRPRCSVARYYENGRCEPCYHFCSREGCSGPGSHVGPGGCKSCFKAKELPDDPSTVQCISSFMPCQNGSYLRRVPVTDPGPLAGFVLCKLCHPLCDTCSGPGAPFCLTCKYYKLNGRCVRNCPVGTLTDHLRKSCNYTSTRHRRRHTSSFRHRNVHIM